MGGAGSKAVSFFTIYLTDAKAALFLPSLSRPQVSTRQSRYRNAVKLRLSEQCCQATHQAANTMSLRSKVSHAELLCRSLRA